MKLLLIYILLFLSQFSFAETDTAATKGSVNCETIKIEACTEFRGRARAYMGRAETRIWKIGSKRLFAVRQKAEQAKTELDKVNFHQDIFGEFRICPTSKFEKGAMQEVCVASITKASTRPTGL